MGRAWSPLLKGASPFIRRVAQMSGERRRCPRLFQIKSLGLVLQWPDALRNALIENHSTVAWELQAHSSNANSFSGAYIVFFAS